MLSVTIITKNEAANLEDCLRSVAFADEILVLDSGSTDNTVEIARQFTDKVFVEEWRGYGKQKNRASELATGDWILNIDADERVTDELREEILGIVARQEPRPPGESKDAGGRGSRRATADCDAYRMPRRNFVCGQWLRHGGWWPDHQIRLWRRGRARWSEVEVHEKLQVDGDPGTLQAPLDHHTYRTLGEYVERQARYAQLAAAERFAAGHRVRPASLPVKFFGKLFNLYVLKQGYRDGSLGLVMACLGAASGVARDALIWEMQSQVSP